MSITTILLFVALAMVSIAFGYYIRYLQALGKKGSLELEIKKILLDAKEEATRTVQEATARAAALEDEKKQSVAEREEKLARTEERLVKKEELLDKRQIDLDSETEAIRGKIEEIKELKTRLDERARSIETKLAEVAELTPEAARELIITRIEHEYEEDLLVRTQKLEIFGNEKLEEKARDIVISAIHRIGNTMRMDVMTATVEIPSDDLKGKIIGKEGRNVRAFERATGVDVLIDESPGHVTLSSFDPIRREIARVALLALIDDGRIQPTKIEEFVEKARIEIADTIQKMGEKAAYECSIHNLHPDLIKILGRLHYRTSYGQNVLWHSVEMAHISAMIAVEVDADVAVARAGALLHDIGKTVSHEVQGTHVEIGRRILEKYGVDEAVIKAMQAHHEEYPYETPESIIVQVADALSGGRPGARRDSIEHYIKRLEDLEAIAKNMDGVEKAFAIQAGREVRVLVNPEAMSDFAAHELAKAIAHKIEAELKYPGEIKVNVIRESRAIEYAR
jgi:ribonuclease Y